MEAWARANRHDPEGPAPKGGAPEEPHPVENAASLLVTIQALAAANQAARPTRLLVITRGGQAIAADSAPAIGAAPLFALVETAPEELPWLDTRAKSISRRVTRIATRRSSSARWRWARKIARWPGAAASGW